MIKKVQELIKRFFYYLDPMDIKFTSRLDSNSRISCIAAFFYSLFTVKPPIVGTLSLMTATGLMPWDANVIRKNIIFAPVMTREELILDCRYYNGEDEIPDSLPEGKTIFWDYERVWVRRVLEGDENLQRNIDYFTKEYDLPHLLPESDGTPLGLKALLFNRYDHWVGIYRGQSCDEYAQQFKSWYLDNYVAGRKTHRKLLEQ